MQDEQESPSLKLDKQTKALCLVGYTTYLGLIALVSVDVFRNYAKTDNVESPLKTYDLVSGIIFGAFAIASVPLAALLVCLPEIKKSFLRGAVIFGADSVFASFFLIGIRNCLQEVQAQGQATPFSMAFPVIFGLMLLGAILIPAYVYSPAVKSVDRPTKALYLAGYTTFLAVMATTLIGTFWNYAKTESSLKTYDLVTGILSGIFVTMGTVMIALLVRLKEVKKSFSRGAFIFGVDSQFTSLLFLGIRGCLRDIEEQGQATMLSITLSAVFSLMLLSGILVPVYIYSPAIKLAKSMCCVLNHNKDGGELDPLEPVDENSPLIVSQNP